MSEWPIAQGYNNVVISTSSPDSIGVELDVLNAKPAVTTWFLANGALYIPFVVSRPFTARVMGVVNGGVTSGNIDVGIYDDQKNRLVSKGSTAQSGISVAQLMDITDTPLNPGVYYMGVACDNTTANFWKFPCTNVAITALGVLVQATAFPLPATAAWTAGSSTGIPIALVSAKTAI